MAAGTIITLAQVLVLYVSNDAVVLVLIGPALGWSVATWVNGIWKHTKLTHAWPIGFADVAWLFLAGGMHDALEGSEGRLLLFGSLAVLSMGAGTACFFGRYLERGKLNDRPATSNQGECDPVQQ